MLQTIAPAAQTNSASQVPGPVVHGTTTSSTEPNFNTALSDNGPSALAQENNAHGCQPPPSLLDLGASLPTLSDSEEGGLERPTTPEGNVARSHDSAFYSLYSSPTSVFTRPVGTIRNNTDSTNEVEAHSLRPTLSQAASSSPKKSALSIGGPTSDSDIIETYANMTTYETDSEEEKMIETAIISTWEAAQLTAFEGSPSEVMSPASLISSADGEGNDTLSPASTFELMTPTLSLDQRRTSRSQSLSWSPQSQKLNAKQPNVARLLLESDEGGEFVPGAEELDLDGMLVQESELAGYPLVDEENMGDDLDQNLAMEPLRFSQVTSADRLHTLRQRHQNSYPTHLQSRSLPSSPLEPTFPTSRSDPNADSLGRDFARPRPSRGRAGALGQHPFSTTGSEEANRLYSSLNSAIGSPHRGMVGLDARSNREAFLYGQQDDEKFKRKLDLRLANVDASPPRTHEDLDMGAGGGRHVGGPAPKQARSLGLTERALSPLQHGRGGASGNGVTSTPGSAKRLESIVRYQVPLNDAGTQRLDDSVHASPLRRSNPASPGIPGKRPSADATSAYLESQAEFEGPRPRRRSIASTGVSAPMSPISPPRSAKDISKTLGQKLGLGSKVYEDKENRQSLKSSRPVSMNSTTMDTRLPDVFGAVVSAAAAQGRARSQVRLKDSSAQSAHASASGLPAPLSIANSRRRINGTRQECITSHSLPLKKKNPLSLKLSGARNQLLNPSAHSSMTSLRSRFVSSSRNPSPTTPTSPRGLSSSTLGRPTPEGNTNTHSDSKNFSSRIPRLRSMNNDLVSEDGIIGANASETSWAVRREGGSGVSSRQDPGPTVGVLPGKDGVRPTRTLALRERQFRTARGDVGGLRRVIPARLPRPGGTVLKENDSMAFGARGRGHIVDDPARRDDALFNRF
ncbi:hypothetical protein DL93DRAFT_2075495 [Clavulina sp. PMI_390]|nr:hypothetical protein DL93DRAFT_2075495 [Clavulina sp. PMI_390]